MCSGCGDFEFRDDVSSTLDRARGSNDEETAAQSAAEPEAKKARVGGGERTVAVGTQPEYFLIGDRDEAWRALVAAKTTCIKSTVARMKEEGTLGEFAADLRAVAPVLVTGSSGYLGSALVEIMRSHEISCQGVDLVSAATTDFAGCVSSMEALRKAGAGCKSVIHTAALHAPNLDFYSVGEFERVNVVGTQNVLELAKESRMAGVVFSSTTSLMNTAAVKLRHREETVVQVASVDYGTPRNIYGVTKKAAEGLCLKEQDMGIAILRCSRFFAEDAYDSGAAQKDRVCQGSNGNVKANEMLTGCRASLEDMAMAHLVALVRISKPTPEGTPRRGALGPYVISSVSPLLGPVEKGADLSAAVAEVTDFYNKFAWSAPPRVGRILDSRESWKALGWAPRWSFERLRGDVQAERNSATIEIGEY